MSVVPAALSAGIGIGLAVAVPVGPMGVLCIQRTLAGGFGAGVATGFGAATTQILWGALALVGLQAWSGLWTDQNARALSLLSALLLAWFAYRIVRRRVGLQVRREGGEGDLRRCFGGAVALGLTNPLTLLLVVAAVPALATLDGDASPSQILAGQFCGALAWWVAVAFMAAVLRTRLSARALGWVNLASGAALALLALRAAARAF